MTSNVENFLAHYGKLGMKWGVRSASAYSGRAGGSRTKKAAEDHTSVSKLRKQKARHLSNDDLKKAISRMNLEKQYRDLNPKGLSRGNKVALSVLALGTTVNSAIMFANSPAGQAVKTAVKNIVGRAVK